MASHENHNCTCSLNQASPSVAQTLDELDFERGIWYQAVVGDIDGVKKCLEKGCDPNEMDRSGYTALHYAGRNGHYKICELLLSRGASVKSKTNSGLSTPLHRAAYMGHADIVTLFLKNGADPKACDADGHTSIDKATKEGHIEVQRLLLESLKT